MDTAYVAVACGNILGETPAWSTHEKALYWVDVRAPALHRFIPETGKHDHWPMPEICGGAVIAERGVVLALRRTIVHFHPERNAFTPLVELEPAELDNRLNEAKCDRTGRLWVGSMRDLGAAVTGSLYSIGSDLRPKRVLQDIRIPNSFAWSPDGGTMYFADTGDGVLRRFRFDPQTGSLADRGTLLSSDGAPGRPDGSTVDVEGHIWNARYAGGCVVRIAPDGRVVSSITLPVSQPTSCAFGGRDLRTLFITTASQGLSAEQRGAESASGHLFAVRTEIPGALEIAFQFH